MIDLAPQIDHAVSFVCFFIPIKRMRSSNLSRIETNLPYCLIAGVQCDDVQNHTGLSSLLYVPFNFLVTHPPTGVPRVGSKNDVQLPGA